MHAATIDATTAIIDARGEQMITCMASSQSTKLAQLCGFTHTHTKPLEMEGIALPEPSEMEGIALPVYKE